MNEGWKILKTVEICKFMSGGGCLAFELIAFRMGATRVAALVTRHTMLSWLIKTTSRRQ